MMAPTLKLVVVFLIVAGLKPCEGTLNITKILGHPLAQQLMVQERLVAKAKKVIPVLLDLSEIVGLRDQFTGALIQAFPDLRPSIPDGAGPLGSSIFDNETFLLSGIADIEYDYDYDTGEFLGLKDTGEELSTDVPTALEEELTTDVPTAAEEELATDVPTTLEEELVTDIPEPNDEENEVDVEGRRPKALDEDGEEDPKFAKMKIGCCWYAASQVGEVQEGRRPKALLLEMQEGRRPKSFLPQVPGPEEPQGGQEVPQRYRGGRYKTKGQANTQKLPIDRILASLTKLMQSKSNFLKGLLPRATAAPPKRPAGRYPTAGRYRPRY